MLRDLTPEGKRLLGLDVGKKNLGIATSDSGWQIATPHSILKRSKFSDDMKALFALIETESNIGGLVIGWPLNMDGSATIRCDSTRDFTHALLKLKDFPTFFQDERLSTQGVERAMLEGDLSRQKRSTKRDALAAAWILQTTLDSARD